MVSGDPDPGSPKGEVHGSRGHAVVVDGDFDVDVFVFDLFGVVIAFDDTIAYARLARHCADPDGAAGQLDGLLAGDDFGTGRLTLAEIHRQLVDAQGLTLSYPAFEATWREPYTWAMPGMAPLLNRLADRYRLVLLSNVDRYYWPVIRAAHPELDRFECAAPVLRPRRREAGAGELPPRLPDREHGPRPLPLRGRQRRERRRGPNGWASARTGSAASRASWRGYGGRASRGSTA